MTVFLDLDNTIKCVVWIHLEELDVIARVCQRLDLDERQVEAVLHISLPKKHILLRVFERNSDILVTNQQLVLAQIELRVKTHEVNFLGRNALLDHKVVHFCFFDFKDILVDPGNCGKREDCLATTVQNPLPADPFSNSIVLEAQIVILAIHCALDVQDANVRGQGIRVLNKAINSIVLKH